jgi:hypothetical protein
MGRPIYERLGFRTVITYAAYTEIESPRRGTFRPG